MSREAILIVEDQAQISRLLRDGVAELGYIPLHADTEQKAKAEVEKSPCLILLDLKLRGGGDGEKLLAYFQSKPDFRRIPVVVVSIEKDERTIARCLELGADDYLVKPFNPVELKARVKNALQRSRLLREVQEAKDRLERILHDVLPAKVVKSYLENGEFSGEEKHDQVALICADVCGFTAECEDKSPRQVFERLNELFILMEALARKHEIEKIRTIGDGFFATANLLEPVRSGRPVSNAFAFACEVIRDAHARGLRVRVGLHYGSVVAGVLGHRPQFDLMGADVNLAFRIENYKDTEPLCVVLSQAAYDEIRHEQPGLESLGACRLRGVTSKQPLYRFRYRPEAAG